MKITRYFKQVNLPSHAPLGMISPERVAQGAEAIGGVAEAFSFASKELGKFIIEKNALDETLEVTSLFNQAKKEISEQELNLRQNPDEETYLSDYQKAIQTIKARILAQAKTRTAQVALEKGLANLESSQMDQNRDYWFRNIYLPKRIGEFAGNLFDFSQEYIKTPDPKRRAEIEAEVKALIDLTAAKLGKDPGATLRKWQDDTLIATVRSDGQLDAMTTRKKLESGGYQGLDEKDRPVLIKEMIQLEKTQREERDLAIFNQKTAELSQKWGTNYDGIFTTIRDPEWQKTNGIEPKVKNAIEDYFNAEMLRAETMRVQNSRKIEQDIFLNLDKKSVADIKNAVRQGLDPDTAEKLIRIKNHPDIPENPRAFLDVRAKILRGGMNWEEQKNMILAAPIPEHRKMELGDLALTWQNTLENREYKRADDFLKQNIFKTKSPLGILQQTTEETNQYFSMVNSLDQELNKIRQSGRPFKEEEIFNIAVRFYKAQEKTPRQKMADEINKGLEGALKFSQPKAPGTERWFLDGQPYDIPKDQIKEYKKIYKNLMSEKDFMQQKYQQENPILMLVP